MNNSFKLYPCMCAVGLQYFVNLDKEKISMDSKDCH